MFKGHKTKRKRVISFVFFVLIILMFTKGLFGHRVPTVGEATRLLQEIERLQLETACNDKQKALADYFTYYLRMDAGGEEILAMKNNPSIIALRAEVDSIGGANPEWNTLRSDLAEMASKRHYKNVDLFEATRALKQRQRNYGLQMRKLYFGLGKPDDLKSEVPECEECDFITAPLVKALKGKTELQAETQEMP